MNDREPAIFDPTGVYQQPEGTGPNGRKLCRWCHEEIAPRRQSWCSQVCVDSYLIRHDWGRIRRIVEERDQGVCVLCGCDTVRLKRIIREVEFSIRKSALLELDFNTDWCRSMWEADHIIPRHRGGEDHPRNLRTLCIPCHKAVTANQARERAIQRRDAGAVLFNQEQAA